MALESPPSVECYIIGVPSGCFLEQSDYGCLMDKDESLIFGVGSNTLLLNEDISKKLKLDSRETCNIHWAILKFNLEFSDSNPESKPYTAERLVQVLIDHRVRDETVVLSEDLLFNLELNSNLRNSCEISSIRKPYKLGLTYEHQSECLPGKATKVILSLIQFEINLEDNFVDKILKRYFSHTRYICKDDVFGVPVAHHHKLDSLNIANIDTVYFKVCEIEGASPSNSELSNNVCWGYFVDSSVTIYQMSNLQDLYPAKRLPVYYKPDLNSLLNNEKLLISFQSRNQNLIPSCFDSIFKVLCNWIEPFLCRFKRLKDIELTPVLIISGQNGSGKTMLVEALSRFFGMNYWRVDCMTVGDPVPGQAEAKLKVIFNRLKNIAPCILHLSNIQALFQDSDTKDDVRVLNCFKQQVKLLKLQWPVVIIASTSCMKSISSNMNQFFLESITVNAPDVEDREDILFWLINCNSGSIDKQILQAVAAQTSGFVFRDLEVLVSLAFKEKCKRSKEDEIENKNFVFPEFSKIIGTMRKAFSEAIGAPKVPSVSWKDVGGLEPLKKEILRSLKSNMFNTGLKRSGLLLHGPPGTGKTLLAKAVATQCGRNFLSVKGPELLNMYVGQSEHNVRDLFELAKAASPCIIFFDELDSLAPNRGRSGDSGGVMDRVVSQLLAEMDDLGKTGDVFVLGATNRPDLIDTALLRPGRLDKLLYVGPCEDRVSQLSVLAALTRKLTLAADVDLEELVSSLPTRVSGAELSALCSAAWLSSAREFIQNGEYKQNPTVVVGQTHFLNAQLTLDMK